MASQLEIFLSRNNIMSPTHLALDRQPIGWVKKDSIKYAPGLNKQAFEADQVGKNIGSIVTDTNGGTIAFAPIELTESIIPVMNDWAAGTDLTSPLAGVAWSNTPNRECTKRQIEMWKLWNNGKVYYCVLAGEVSKPFAMDMSSGTPMIPEVSFDLVVLNNAYPDGFTHLYDAISGALTATFSPADEATGVAVAGAITVSFNKPLPATALSGDFWTLVDESGNDIAFTPSFGTRTAYGLTLTDFTKVVLTPTSALTADTDYTVTCSGAFYSLDLTRLGTDATATFTTAAS